MSRTRKDAVGVGTVALTDVATGPLLQEVSRAYFHSGLPSAVMYRLEMGLRAAMGEMPEGSEDVAFAGALLDQLVALYTAWRTAEDDYYRNGGPTAAERAAILDELRSFATVKPLVKK